MRENEKWFCRVKNFVNLSRAFINVLINEFWRKGYWMKAKDLVFTLKSNLFRKFHRQCCKIVGVNSFTTYYIYGVSLGRCIILWASEIDNSCNITCSTIRSTSIVLSGPSFKKTNRKISPWAKSPQKVITAIKTVNEIVPKSSKLSMPEFSGTISASKMRQFVSFIATTIMNDNKIEKKTTERRENFITWMYVQGVPRIYGRF